MLKLKSPILSICFIHLVFTLLLHAQNLSQIKNDKTANLIHFGDLIDVDVLGSAEFDWRGTLNPEGFLDGVDFAEEPIYALCQNEETVAAAVAKGYSKILRNPQVVVKILDKSGRAVSYLYGAVKTPQRFQIERPVRLNELLILAGGIDEKASGQIQLLRTNSLNCKEEEPTAGDSANILINRKDNNSEVFKIDISELIKGGNQANPLILNGDIITVSEAEPIYVIGGVANPRKINARAQTTVTRAIASAGGFAKNADLKNIVIFRRNKNGNLRLEVDYEKIKANENTDLVLQKFDILEVGQTGEEKRKFSPIVKIFDTQTKPLELPLRVIDE